MKASALIEARLKGAPMERILDAVERDREQVSTLSDDTSDFFGTMVSQVETAVRSLKTAVLKEDLASIKGTAESLQEIFQMIGDAAK